MIIKPEIIRLINNRRIRINICAKIGIGEQAIIVHINNNSNNGRLTKIDALMSISEQIGKPVGDLVCESQSEKAS